MRHHLSILSQFSKIHKNKLLKASAPGKTQADHTRTIEKCDNSHMVSINHHSGKVAFVTGANGITGNALIEHLIRQPASEW